MLHDCPWIKGKQMHENHEHNCLLRQKNAEKHLRVSHDTTLSIYDDFHQNS